ncbi:MAG: helix-turn-helix domain-containing protein [Oscillospiraceae bacterium]|nr:helix-turn-helix domain-containing protein [Oscillospiraceae bacterium]
MENITRSWLSYKSKDILVSYFTITPHRLDTHFHKYYEFLWFIKGNASYITGSNTYLLEADDIIITRPEKMHTISFNDDSKYERAFIQISPRLLSMMPRALVKNIIGTKNPDGNIIKKDIAQKYELYRFYTELIEMLQNRTEKNEFLAELLIQRFAVAVNDAIADTNSVKESENTVVSRLKEYLDDNCISEFNLDKIASSFFMSKYYLCHLFKEETGITISDYVALKRIAAVREHLNNDVPITEVYRRCGFNDYSSFYRAVKKYTGKKPSEFYK